MRSSPGGWKRGASLVTLRTPGDYITKLQAAAEALLLVVKYNGPTMFARIDVMRALNRHVEREFDSLRKDKHRGLRKLKRDE
jgi:hypothetical protein